MRFREINREIGFMAGVAAYVIVLMIAGSGLSPDSLLFPGLIMAAVGLIIGLKLLVYKFPQLKFLDPGGNVGSMIRGGDGQTPREEEKSGKRSSIYDPVAFIIWLVTFPLGIYFVGFMVTVAVWLFVFLFVMSRLRLFKALLICACTLVGIYFVFIGALRLHFPPGILF